MSALRPECGIAWGPALSDATALFLIRDSVARRRALIHGHLADNKGRHCAVGAFWADNPKAFLNNELIDEVSAVNDSIPPTATPRKRWKKVMSWLRWKLKVLGAVREK